MSPEILGKLIVNKRKMKREKHINDLTLISLK
jgi:hypothetical protein